MQTGIYLHHKGGLYLVSETAKHTETGEELVIYHDMEDGTYARPTKMFSEEVEHDGVKVPRFQLVRVVSYHGMTSKDIIQESVRKALESHEEKESPCLIRGRQTWTSRTSDRTCAARSRKPS